jgi:predicted MFS family arabinose efflux permease
VSIVEVPQSRSLAAPGAPREGVPAIIISALLGEYSLLIMPFIVTAMMQGYGLSEAGAGYLVSLQLLAMGIAALAVSYLLARIEARRIVIAAAFLVSIANVGCALGAGVAELAVARGATGLAEGALMAAAGALAAGVRQPHKLFSTLGFIIAAVAAAALLLTPFLFAHLGARGIFWLLAVSPIAVLLAAPSLPRAGPRSADVPHLSAFAVNGALSVLVAFALLWIGASALWVFAERIGASQGLSLPQVGAFLAIGQVAGVAGPVIAARFGERGGLHGSIAVGAAAMAMGGLLMVFGGLQGTYVVGVSLLSIAVMFLTPCFRTLMAQLDGTGGVVAMSAAFYTAGFGAAPLLVGAIESAGASYGAMAWMATAAFAASGILAFRSGSGADAEDIATGT